MKASLKWSTSIQKIGRGAAVDFHLSQPDKRNLICFYKYKEDGMDAHFFFGIALIGFFFWLCFRFRKENKNK